MVRPLRHNCEKKERTVITRYTRICDETQTIATIVAHRRGGCGLSCRLDQTMQVVSRMAVRPTRTPAITNLMRGMECVRVTAVRTTRTTTVKINTAVRHFSPESNPCGLRSAVGMGGGCIGLTTQAQRPGPRERRIATVMRWPGSLQRLVSRQCRELNLHKT
jgi:hypothetical protein